MKRVVQRYKRLLADLRTASGKKSGTGTGQRADKEKARDLLTDSLVQARGLITGLAVDKEDETLKSKGNFSKSDLKSLRDGELPIFADNLIEPAGSLRSEREPYGLTDALRADLEANLGRNREYVDAPRKAINTRKTAGGDMTQRKFEVCRLSFVVCSL